MVRASMLIITETMELPQYPSFKGISIEQSVMVSGIVKGVMSWSKVVFPCFQITKPIMDKWAQYLAQMKV